MYRDKVFHIATQEDICFIPDNTKFEFKSDKRCHWLQNLCVWIMKKLGCQVIDRVVTHNTVRVEIDSFMDALYEMRRDLFSSYHENGERIIMGPDAFYDLTGSSSFRSMLNFTGTYSRSENGAIKACGMEITVIPWMEGILVLPELKSGGQ